MPVNNLFKFKSEWPHYSDNAHDNQPDTNDSGYQSRLYQYQDTQEKCYYTTDEPANTKTPWNMLEILINRYQY